MVVLHVQILMAQFDDKMQDVFASRMHPFGERYHRERREVRGGDKERRQATTARWATPYTS
jgi:hypothetical protein